MAVSASNTAMSGYRGTVRIATFDDGIGAVDEVAEVKKWTFTAKCDLHAYASNFTGGWKERVAGTADGSGSLECVWNDPTVLAQLRPGTKIYLELWYDAVSVPQSRWQMIAFTENFKHEVNMDTGDIVGFSCDFQTHGIWVEPGAA